ncbi:hypothetical protein [Streptomyces sp. NPDC059161]|uniref:hypothetical protein n=1 Tax=unclassified Streptomyces TaxID=2593676 RepID=UPI0036614501
MRPSFLEPLYSSPAPSPGVFAGPGGVLTNQGGTLSGELTVRTVWEQGQARVAVQYEAGGE